MKKISLLILILLGTMMAAGCTKGQAPPAQPGRISATPAFEKYFGPAPTTDKGTCFAFVIYFPSARDTGKVVPFPFFSFDQGSVERVAVERLLAGIEVPAYRDEIAQPFAPTARLLALEQVDGLKRVDLSDGFLAPGADRGAMLHALVMTLTQFPQVHGVRVLQHGKDLDWAEGPLKPEGEWVREPGPPRLLSVTAVKDKGGEAVKEVNAFFDRPVEITTLKIMDNSGKPFEGDVYHSVFDMAAVLKPQHPEQFIAGMPVQVRWDVTDKLGRAGRGAETFPLEVREHAE